MKPLYTQKEYKNANSMDKLPCECYICSNTFYTEKRTIKASLKKTVKATIHFCSVKCRIISSIKKQTVTCKQCEMSFLKEASEIKKSPNHFCSRSCAATYNNTHKTYGIRRSKLEIYLEGQLTVLYPDLHIDYNKKEAINSELDIYIPSLKIAIELNGIFHYEPIYGEKKLSRTQNNDHRKFQACAEQYISLCIIDTSKQKYFKESTSQEFLNIIINIINNKSKNI